MPTNSFFYTSQCIIGFYINKKGQALFIQTLSPPLSLYLFLSFHKSFSAYILSCLLFFLSLCIVDLLDCLSLYYQPICFKTFTLNRFNWIGLIHTPFALLIQIRKKVRERESGQRNQYKIIQSVLAKYRITSLAYYYYYYDDYYYYFTTTNNGNDPMDWRIEGGG